jgi:hypothetical protein
MKQIFTFFLVLLTISTQCQNLKRLSKKTDRQFKHHFAVLDSAMNAQENDTVYYCHPPSIEFMELHTGILSKTDISIVGKMQFTKTAYQQWLRWYQKRKRK